MSASRLYRAAGATGPQANDAVEALAESAQRPRLVPESSGSTETDLLVHVLAGYAPEGPAEPADIPEPLPEAETHQPALRLPPAPTKQPTTVPVSPAAPAQSSPTWMPASTDITPPASSRRSPRTTEEPSPLARVAELAARTPSRTLTWTPMVVTVVVAGLILGFATALVLDGFGWFVGLPLAGLTMFLTLRLTLEDRWAGAVAAPLAWLLVIVVPGQLTVTHDGSVVLTQVLLIAQGLSDNAIWIVVPAVVGAVVARRRGHHAD